MRRFGWEVCLVAEVAMAAALALAPGCASKPAPPPAAPGGSADEAHWPADDQSLCNRFVHWKTTPPSR